MRCPVCGSQRLTPLAELRTTLRIDGLLLRFGRQGNLQFAPTVDRLYARVCLDCGAVTPFVGDQDRQRLNLTRLIDATE
ncbi:MAG: hypothetical protein J2P15_09470 [Micromonosporaceae bacterium]|nr:hypothetical protein [Micromonosporaceae bacterium]